MSRSTRSTTAGDGRPPVKHSQSHLREMRANAQKRQDRRQTKLQSPRAFPGFPPSQITGAQEADEENDTGTVISEVDDAQVPELNWKDPHFGDPFYQPFQGPQGSEFGDSESESPVHPDDEIILGG